MFYYYLGMTVVFILGTIGVRHIRRRMGNSGIETPIIGAALWILMTIFFLDQFISGPPQKPVVRPEIGSRKSPQARPGSDSRSVFRPPKMKGRPARYIEDDDENDFSDLEKDAPEEIKPESEE